MDKRTNTPHDDFSVEEILQEARLLREQQGEEITFSVATTDQKPASERAQATPVEQDAKAVAQQPGKRAGAPSSGAQGARAGKKGGGTGCGRAQNGAHGKGSAQGGPPSSGQNRNSRRKKSPGN